MQDQVTEQKQAAPADQMPSATNIFEEQAQQKSNNFESVAVFLESIPFQIVIFIITLYCLFGDDIRVAGFRQSADIVFDGLNISCLVTSVNTKIIFSIEILLTVLSKEGYFLSFFFWLDVISTISLLLDINMFNEAVGLTGSAKQAKNTASLARAGRASRVGTKAGRVVRLVRLIRLVKLYKSATKEEKEDKVQKLLQQRRHKRKINSVEPQIQQQKATIQEDEEKVTEESRVSKALSDLTTKKVILLVLILLFLIPLFSTDYYVSPPTSMQIQSEQFVKFTVSKETQFPDIQNAYKQIIDDHKALDTPVVYFISPFSWDNNRFPTYEDPDYVELRLDEFDIGTFAMNITEFQRTTKDAPLEYYDAANLNESSVSDVVGVLSRRSMAVTSAILSIIRTIFVSGVLTFGALMFSKDSNDLALRPLERLIDKVNKIAQNPQVVHEMALVKEESNETVKIENTIIKIGTLLALGFGEAGTEIIRVNMKRQGDVNPMIEGIKKVAIYGFCDIRNFTDATEVLQEDVMMFVNNIGDIVHTVVDRYQGTANKNIGDAFLLVWKTRQDTYKLDGDNVQWLNEKYISDLSDCALLSFMKIQAKINREPKILAYRKDQRLQQRMDNYKVKIGYGLHLGWGIEGAIGSIFKIDASYLSPNVNMASRLEAATKQFGVPLLISQDLYDRFSSGIKSYVRMIDKVTVKGSTQPMGLFTIDMNYENLPPSGDPLVKHSDFSKDELREILRLKKLDLLDLIEAGQFDAVQHMFDNKDLELMMKNFNKSFFDAFNAAFKKYLDGDWKEAKQMFQEALKHKSADGPTESLLNVMKETNFQKPADWKGYRELTEK